MKKMVAVLLLLALGCAGSSSSTGSGIVTTTEEFVDIIDEVRWEVLNRGMRNWGAHFFWCVCEKDRGKWAYAWKIYLKRGPRKKGSRHAEDVRRLVKGEASRFGGCFKTPVKEKIL